MRQLVLVASALLCASCATKEIIPQAQSTRDHSGEVLVGQKSDARSRAKAHTDLAGAYYELGNMAVALEEARLALEADASYAPAHNVLGLVHMDLKEIAEAQASFERALRLAPQDPDVNHNFAWFLCQNGREEQAIAYFMNAVRNPLYATPAKSYSTAGTCLLKAKRSAEALTYFDRALQLDANFAPAMLPLARLLLERGQIEEARRIVTRLNNVAPPTAESLWLALRIERRRGDSQAEASYAAQLRRRFPDSPEMQALARGQYE